MIVGYEAAALTNAAASSDTTGCYIEFRGNGVRRAKVREWGIFSKDATSALRQGLGRPAAAGITPATNSLGQAQDPADAAATAQFSSSWGTQPTAPAVYLRQWNFNNVIGSGVIFTWPSDGELIVPASGVATLVLYNPAASGQSGPACHTYSVWSE
jgi:hypothetical protein